MTGVNISANVDFDWTTGAVNGTGQYLASGSYDPTGICQAVSFTPTQWLTMHPPLVPARSIVGRVSEDRESYSGDYVLNPNCQCTGVAPTGYNGTGDGSSCFLNVSTGISFCYVGPSCPDSTPDPIHPGFQTAPCGQFVNCSGFTLSRICSTFRPSCPIGWTGYQYNCYKFFSTPANFTSANKQCAATNGTLVSILSAGENAFVNSTWNNVCFFVANAWNFVVVVVLDGERVVCFLFFHSY